MTSQDKDLLAAKIVASWKSVEAAAAHHRALLQTESPQVDIDAALRDYNMACRVYDALAVPFCPAFRVVGDHPIMARPDRVFRGEGAESRANVYASVLRDQGYENVKCGPYPAQ